LKAFSSDLPTPQSRAAEGSKLDYPSHVVSLDAAPTNNRRSDYLMNAD